MLMTETEFPEGSPISGYVPGGFGVAGRKHEGGLLILPGRMGTWTPATPPTPEDFEEVLAARADIDVLLIGLGADIAVLPRPVAEALDAVSLGFDVMATPAACRTYNVLLAENRRVAAALSPI
jgi:uncharacterized protein